MARCAVMALDWREGVEDGRPRVIGVASGKRP